MPSIVPFGKFFCRYFTTAKFLRDFEGFRPRETLLLYSVVGESHGLIALRARLQMG